MYSINSVKQTAIKYENLETLLQAINPASIREDIAAEVMP